MSEHSALFEAIVEGNRPAAVEQVRAMLDQGLDAQRIMGEHLIPAMADVGEKFECSEYFVPDLLIAAKAMEEAMAILNPILKKSGIEKIGRVVIGTVQGDLHDIGKNLVASMLEGGGFEVVDLGVDVSPAKFIAAASEKEGTVIAMSALLTTTMPQMQKVIEELQKSNLRNTTKVMIGGAPITQDYADSIGADGYSDNASSAVALAKRLCNVAS